MADSSESFHGLALDSIEMLINVGLMESVSNHWPSDVQERWGEKIDSMRDQVNTFTVEVQEFASAWDEPADEDGE